MSRYDLVVFGATGFTGRNAVKELVRLSQKYSPLTWTVAGRSQQKLQDVLTEATKSTGKDLSTIEPIIADVSDEASLKAMCARAAVLVNCCGPYRLYGEPVVRAAVEAGTHYVDVSGEPQFMETMQLRYDALAREKRVFIISACGFDSIPNDMGVVFLQKQFQGTVNSVESYLSTYIPPEHRAEAQRTGTVHFGTWESLVYGVTHMNELPALRKKIYPEKLPTFKPKLQQRMVIHSRDSHYYLPFPGADSSIVYRSQRHQYEHEHQRPIQFKPYVRVGGLGATIGAIFWAVWLYVFCFFGFTRQLLLKYPGFFSFGQVSHSGPSETVMNNCHFRFTLHGEGWSQGKDVETATPDKRITVQVSGVNPGYGATVTALLLSGYTILRQQDKMPTGGVLTTAVAFKDTNLIDLLQDNGLKFEVLDQK